MLGFLSLIKTPIMLVATRFVVAALLILCSVACAMDSIPVVTLKVDIGSDDQSDFENFMISFAKERNFSIRDLGRESGLAGGRKVASLRLLRADGVAIGVGDYLDGTRFWVSIYDDKSTGDWNKLYEDLMTEMRARWPNTEIEHIQDQ